MFKSFLLSFCLISMLFATATIKKDIPATYRLSPVSLLQAGDSIPVIKKDNLLKKLAEAIKFRKKAKAKEQMRVLAIIDNSGLKKSLDSINNKIAGIDNLTGKDSSLAELQNAVKELRAIIKANIKAGNGFVVDSSIPDPAALTDLPPKDKEIENLVNQLLPLLNNSATAEQQEKEKWEKLRLVRRVMFRPPNMTDTMTVSDTLKRVYTIQLRNKAFVTGFYHYQHSHSYTPADWRMINTLAYYGITFNGRTGNITGLNGWDTATVIADAQQQGCAVTLTVINADAADVKTFLINKKAQRKLTEHIIALLAMRQANGVHIYFEHLTATSRNHFVEFIRTLSDNLKMINPDYLVNVVLPSSDTYNAYDLASLNDYTDHFLVDFTQRINKIPGPLAPLQGTRNNDLTTCLSRYWNKNIPPEKFIVYLPYYGVIYRVNNKGDFNNFFHYISYNEIRNTYPSQVQFDKVTSAAFIDITATGAAPSGETEELEEVIGRIWFDDEKTLSLKYDFILQSGLGGIAIQAVGYDGEYGELRDALINKFMLADTVYTADINTKPVVQGPAPLDDWQWTWPYITAKYEQYQFLFAYPCETTYPKILVRRWQKAGVVNADRAYVKNEATIIFGVTSLILLLVALAILFVFIYQVRRLAKWKWKKLFAWLLIVLTIFLTATACMFLFLDNQIAGFGTSDSPQDCFDFPLSTLAAFITTGLLIGGIITRFLVFPLIKKEDIP